MPPCGYLGGWKTSGAKGEVADGSDGWWMMGKMVGCFFCKSLEMMRGVMLLMLF